MEPCSLCKGLHKFQRIARANNNRTGSTITTTIPGDINGDFKVSFQDLGLLANPFDSTPGTAKWNPNADVNGNGQAELRALVLLAQHYGQHYNPNPFP